MVLLLPMDPALPPWSLFPFPPLRGIGVYMRKSNQKHGAELSELVELMRIAERVCCPGFSPSVEYNSVWWTVDEIFGVVYIDRLWPSTSYSELVWYPADSLP